MALGSKRLELCVKFGKFRYVSSRSYGILIAWI